MRRPSLPGEPSSPGSCSSRSRFILWVSPSSSFLLLPDEAKPLETRVTVEGEKPDRAGGIYFVDVIVRKASRLEELFSFLRPDGADIVPEEALVPPGPTSQDRRRQNLRQMTRSQQVAAAVALRELGYDVEGRAARARSSIAVASDAPAAGKLEPTDVIVGVDGKAVSTPGRPAPRSSRCGSRARRSSCRSARAAARDTVSVGHGREPVGARPRDRRHPGRAVRGHRAADRRLDRSRRGRRPLRGARVRARHRRGAARERRPRAQGRGDRARSSSTAESCRSAA